VSADERYGLDSPHFSAIDKKNLRSEGIGSRRSAPILNCAQLVPLLCLRFGCRPDLGLRCYFPEDTTPAGRVVQKAVNGVVKEQKQPVAQAWVALQLPPHVVAFWAGFRNCRAETVPAQRTAVSMAASNVVLIFFVINALLFDA